MMGFKNFPIPTQVKFYNIDEDNWLNGIAYNMEVICGCCGGVIPLEELYDEEILEREEYPVRILTNNWVDISDFLEDN